MPKVLDLHNVVHNLSPSLFRQHRKSRTAKPNILLRSDIYVRIPFASSIQHEAKTFPCIILCWLILNSCSQTRSERFRPAPANSPDLGTWHAELLQLISKPFLFCRSEQIVMSIRPCDRGAVVERRIPGAATTRNRWGGVSGALVCSGVRSGPLGCGTWAPKAQKIQFQWCISFSIIMN